MTIIALQNSQPHPRRIIRNQVKSLLLQNTLMSEKWFCSRPHPMFLQEMPCGLIYFTEESNDTQNRNPISYERVLTLCTEVQRRQETEVENDLDDWLDSRAFEIEAALMDSKFLNLSEKSFIRQVILLRTECTQINFEGDADVASIRLFWEIIYHTDSWNPHTIEEFLRFNATYTGQLGDGARAEDHVVIREE